MGVSEIKLIPLVFVYNTFFIEKGEIILIPSILQLAGAILLAILIFMRSDNQSIRLSAVIVDINGKKNPKIKDIIKETWVIRFGLSLVIIGYILQILNYDIVYLMDMNRLGKFLWAAIITSVIVGLFMFLAQKISHIKYEKLPTFDKNSDNHPDGAIMVEIEE